MNDRARCRECGKPLETPDSGCPACLLNLALETSSDAETPAPSPSEDRHRLSPGNRIGPYEIVRELGEGGMGVVYLAEQVQPIKRQVALKVIKHGMDTDQVVKRFEAERQALALMDHVAIARVFEAGETESGRPYFAMEYIDGESVTAFCDRHRLGTAKRLELFSDVCDGLQHAHQRGIIHRDIKPSNILVTATGSGPQPKIIDFGVAKATEQSLVEHSAMTAMGVLLGTPEYMSPEQANLSPHDVDTRTDVYSLGVVLYELLIGVPPLDTGSLRKAAFDEIRRQIKEVRPSKPSTRISQLGRRASDMARLRQVDIASLRRRLSGDLDLIAMKALEKDRDRRYGSPAELAADIRRHLTSQPILARPPSLIYHLRKAAARNRLASALAAAVVVVAIGAVAVNVVQHGRTRAERDRATLEAETAKQVSSFLQELFAVADPNFARGRDISVRDVLDRGAERIEIDLAGQTTVQVRLMVHLGNIYRRLGYYEEAIRLLERAVELGGESMPDHPRLDVDRMDTLARAYRDAGRYDEGLAMSRRAVERAESTLKADDSMVVDSRTQLGALLRDTGEFDAAAEVLNLTLELSRKHAGEEAESTGWVLFHLGWLDFQRGNSEAASAHYEQGCAILETALQTDAPGIAGCFNDHGKVLQNLRRLDEAREKQGRALDIWERVLPPDHPQLANGLETLGSLYYFERDYGSAESHYRQSLEIRERTLGESHIDVGSSLVNLGTVYRDTGDIQAAEEHFRRGLEILETAGGVDNPRAVNTLFSIAPFYEDQGHFEEASKLYERAIASRERTHGPEHPWTAGALAAWARTQMALDRYDAAAPAFNRALKIADAHFPPDNKGRIRFAQELADCESRRGRVPRALEILEGIDGLQQRAGLEDDIAAQNAFLYARIARLEGRSEDADAWLERAIEIRQAFETEPSFAQLYFQAVLETHRADERRALDRLAAALNAGLKKRHVDLDVDFAPLKDNRELQTLLRDR